MGKFRHDGVRISLMQAFASQRSSGAICAASLSHLACFVLAHANQIARLEIPSCSRGERQGTEFHCLTAECPGRMQKYVSANI